MAEPRIIHNLIEQIVPATRSSTSLPVTFLDLPVAGPIYVKRQFFYSFPNISTPSFRETTLPTLKHSLSLTLQHFFPLAGNLLCPPESGTPYIRCTDDDSVPLTIIESSADFNHLSSDHPKSFKDLDHLVPKLTFTLDDDDDTFIFPLLALQASVFPNQGLCIAITYCHVMDDNCCDHFMKSWSSIHQTGGVRLIPLFDRDVLRDLRGLESDLLRDYYKVREGWKKKLIGQSQTTKPTDGDEEEPVKATIVFSREEIKGLNSLVLNEWKKKDEELNDAPQFLSTFVVMCAFIWSSMVKTRNRNGDDKEQEEIKDHFRFAGDCRVNNRLGYTIPKGYFGNCLTLCYATLTREELKGGDGFVKAVRVVERAVTEMKKDPFKDAKGWRVLFDKMFKDGSVLFVTGSNHFTVYDTDFGFGKPIKVEMAHSDIAMSLAQSRKEKGGLEFGLVFRTAAEFEYFNSIVKQGLVEALKS